MYGSNRCRKISRRIKINNHNLGVEFQSLFFYFFMLKNLFYIFIGGGVGSIFRFLISNYTQRLWNINLFPMGTFMVNILGCFAIGLLSGYFLKVDNQLKFLLITGFCGGFTTFSTFSAEMYSLFQNQNFGIMFLYALLSMLLGGLAVWLGFLIVSK